MKKGMFFAFAASSLLFSACSSDDAVVSTVGQNEAVQQIVLQVASSGDGLTTRAGRPLYSSQALQSIENVRFLIYKNDDTKTVVYDSKKTDWTKSVKYDNTTGHGRQITITFKGEQKLKEGNYKVIAVGYSNESKYRFVPNVDGTDAITAYEDIKATLAAGNAAEEVFAGEAEVKVDSKQQITNKTTNENGVAVTMHRQVAGAFGYFTNIPASVDGKTAKTLRLVVRGKNDVLTFNNFNSAFTTNTPLKYAVNGSTSTGAALNTTDKFFNGDAGYVLYSIDLTKWYKNGDTNKDGLLTKEDGWTHPTDVKTTLVKGSVFGSNFIIPFELTTGKNTMELQLLAEDGTIIKTWNVSIPSEDVNNEETLGKKDESASIFNVVRNHMYNLGVKASNGGTDPEPGKPDPEPGKPDPENPDPDKPEDLSKGQNLILKVNDNWEAIHQMELD